MSESEKKIIANDADMIVRGFAFKRKGNRISVVNLNQNTPHAMLMAENGTVLESSMDPIEQVIVLEIWENDAEFMEAANA